jgi:hypothetical protein
MGQNRESHDERENVPVYVVERNDRTIIGADIDEFVAWDGGQYVLRPTKESVLADEGLKLIGSVRTQPHTTVQPTNRQESSETRTEGGH